jgi:hypothetical protein
MEADYKTHPHKDYIYWLYDPSGDGMMYFKTKEDRDLAAEFAIDGYRDDGEWDEDIEGMSYGIVTHAAQCIDKKMRPEKLNEDCRDAEGVYWPENIEWFGNYTMEPLDILNTAEQNSR